jgi:hypothetical protein
MKIYPLAAPVLTVAVAGYLGASAYMAHAGNNDPAPTESAGIYLTGQHMDASPSPFDVIAITKIPLANSSSPV